MPPGITVARSSWFRTRTIATRSNSPATEYTSETPSRSAIACAASEISSISHSISTTACTLTAGPSPRRRSRALQHHGQPLPTRDAQRGEPEARIPGTHRVGERQQDAGAAHPDRVAERDPAAVHVQAVAVELQLALAGDHLRGKRLVDLDQVHVRERQPGLLEHLLR